ncbi:MAG: hypothetical protein AB7S81_08455 [Bdellovibrionales bacterium]
MTIDRLFTTGSLRPEDMVRTKTCLVADERIGLNVPEGWSLEAAEAFSAALHPSMPSATQTTEENTVPSWLWSRRPATATTRHAEDSVMAVFHRIAGAAAYRGWKAGLWKDEIEASVFYDEARAALLTRRMAFAPEAMAQMGLDWAYGEPLSLACAKKKTSLDTLILQNEEIDNILSQSHTTTHNKWHKFCEESRYKDLTNIAFADTLHEWDTRPCPASAPRIQINLLAFCQADGSVDTSGLQQTAKLAVLLAELHEDVWRWEEERPLAIGFTNLAALLMSLGIPYDSAAARTTAAAIAAIISGTATCTSAKLAERLGSSSRFSQKKEGILRTLRNRLRACFGEETDYEKLSVIPQTITLESGADLVLISAARHACEKALEFVATKGLRHLQVTSLFTDHNFASLLDSSAQGTEAENALIRDYQQEDGSFHRCAVPAIALGMQLRGYDKADCEAIQEHLIGARTLIGAPGINHAFLKEKGFDEATLARIEANLTDASHIRQVFTPWALGIEFCQTVLGIPTDKQKDMRFDMLRYLDFTAREISVANAFCCGHENVRGAAELTKEDFEIFVSRDDLSPESQIRMAASVQPFIDGETNLTLSIPAAVVAQIRGELILMAWKMGVKNMNLALDGLPPMEATAALHLMKRSTESARTKAQRRIIPRKQSRSATSRRTGIRDQGLVRIKEC